MAELLGLAATCFLAATLLPFPSEAALLAYLHLRPGHAALASRSPPSPTPPAA
jgi:membrane protein YqaA with SNARE-associated domain